MVPYRIDWSKQDSEAANRPVFPISEPNAEEQCPGSPPRMNACCFGLNTLAGHPPIRLTSAVSSPSLYPNSFTPEVGPPKASPQRIKLSSTPVGVARRHLYPRRPACH